jgi:DNA-binding protein HU-beta
MANQMTKAQLVAAVAAEMGADKKAAVAALDAIAAVVTREVKAGGAVTLPGLGKIYARDRAARTVKNPATGELIHKDADRVVKMTLTKAFREAVNG